MTDRLTYNVHTNGTLKENLCISFIKINYFIVFSQQIIVELVKGTKPTK